nr:protein Wnt-6 isoform X1 [Anas platyrhynchos]|eukprot:XP_027317745.1 protein Wnt-6 isoform X1 [Anas platyrhynchos]
MLGGVPSAASPAGTAWCGAGERGRALNKDTKWCGDARLGQGTPGAVQVGRWRGGDTVRQGHAKQGGGAGRAVGAARWPGDARSRARSRARGRGCALRAQRLASRSPPARPALSVPPGSGFPVGGRCFRSPVPPPPSAEQPPRRAPAARRCLPGPAQPGPARPGTARPGPSGPGLAEGGSGHPAAGPRPAPPPSSGGLGGGLGSPRCPPAPGRMLPPSRTQLGLFFILLCPANIIGLWWAVGSPLVMDPNSICRKTKRLAGKQAELCQLEPEIVQEVAKGTKLGVRECQYQFRFRRWNCTSHSKYFGKILQQDIRETAFVYAITAAGVSHAITQACSMGELLQCGCELTRSRAPPSPTAGPGTEGTAWEWGGCGDDVQFGYEKSQQFMDAKSKKGKNDIRALIDLHNNEAGRLAVRSYMRTECKCHGLSGSCTLRTCWRKMPHFREVGDRLLERFNGAFKVMGGNDGKTLIPVGDNIKPPDKQDLIYSADSPDFCSANRKTGSLGTRGRVCNSTAMDTSGCDLLCCGRGHRDETVVLEENCLCRFHWCCVVQCRKCSVRQELSLCV